MEIIAVDIGGTHARFAVAEITDGRVVSLGEPVTQRTSDHATLQGAWRTFVDTLEGPCPSAAAIAVASPIRGDVIKLTNNPWVIQPAGIEARLGVERALLINDFGAVGHAVAQLGVEWFEHLCGPDTGLPDPGVTTICGPGTGLGVAQLLRARDHYHVIETEGGHIDFAPLDGLEDAIVKRLRRSYTRVSAERITSGPGIVPIYETMAHIEGLPVATRDDRALWEAAMSGEDALAAAALERFCLALGGVAGDLALAHGARGVVIAGGLGLRIREHLLHSGFPQRFVAKGRFQSLMASIPVKLITHPQPGLFGAAAAFAQEHRHATR